MYICVVTFPTACCVRAVNTLVHNIFFPGCPYDNELLTAGLEDPSGIAELEKLRSVYAQPPISTSIFIPQVRITLLSKSYILSKHIVTETCICVSQLPLFIINLLHNSLIFV